MQDITPLLNRIAFGPRPRDVERLLKLGLEKYVEEQLHPEHIDDSDIENRLLSIPSIRMTARETIEKYRQPRELARMLLQELVAQKIVRHRTIELRRRLGRRACARNGSALERTGQERRPADRFSGFSEEVGVSYDDDAAPIPEIGRFGDRQLSSGPGVCPQCCPAKGPAGADRYLPAGRRGRPFDGGSVRDKHYAPPRPQIAIPDAADLDGFFGLHPSLESLKRIFDERHLAVVHAAGSPATTRSHFDAQDYMESGTPGRKGTSDGWINRYMQSAAHNGGTPFRAVAMSAILPRSMTGAQPAIAMQRISDFGIRGGRATPEIEDLFAGLYRDTFEAVKLLRKVNPQQYGAAAGVEYPKNPFGQALLQAAQLIKSDIGVEIAFAEAGGWDTHANQGSSRGQLSNQLKIFGDGIAALYRDIGDRMRDIVIVTMTEFGRAVRQNGSGGTDHGHGSCMFVLGGAVRGGKVYGRWPGLAPEELFEGRDLAVTTDFRDVFSEILTKHMRFSLPLDVFPGFLPGKPLGLFEL